MVLLDSILSSLMNVNDVMPVYDTSPSFERLQSEHQPRIVLFAAVLLATVHNVVLKANDVVPFHVVGGRQCCR
jgi:hypothetical protein